MGKIIKYKMELEVLTPVHIAGADYKSKLDKKEYLFNPNKGHLTIIDNGKFVELLIRKNLFDKYAEFIKENVNNDKHQQNRNMNLLNFLKNNSLYEDLKKFTKKEYAVNISTGNGKINDIKLLNRNIYENLYIQGSSIKGALVNALLVDYIINNRNEFMAEKNNILKLAYQTKESDIKKYKGKVKSEIKEIEKKILYNGNESKVKRFGISVSDSYEMGNEIKINFYQDIDEEVSNRKEKYMPVIREYIETGNKFEFDITIDFEVLAKTKLKINNYDELIRKLENATSYLTNNTLNLTGGTSIQNLILGANTGFHQKTIVHALFEDKDERLQVVKRLLHRGGKDAVGLHLNDKFSPRVINRIRKQKKLELAGLVKISKVSEKEVGK